MPAAAEGATLGADVFIPAVAVGDASSADEIAGVGVGSGETSGDGLATVGWEMIAGRTEMSPSWTVMFKKPVAVPPRPSATFTWME